MVSEMDVATANSSPPRSPSPSSSRNSPVLTPKSKLKAILAEAGFSDDSEDDIVGLRRRGFEEGNGVSKKEGLSQQSTPRNSKGFMRSTPNYTDGGDDVEMEDASSPSCSGDISLSGKATGEIAQVRSIDRNFEDDSDSDIDTLFRKERLEQLVAKRRKEREAEEEAQKEREEQMKPGGMEEGHSAGSSDDESNISGGSSRKRRPKRLAGRKADDAIAAETQRFKRNMQLKPEVKTKKKITKQSLFERFHYQSKSALEGSTQAEHVSSESRLGSSTCETSAKPPTGATENPCASAANVTTAAGDIVTPDPIVLPFAEDSDEEAGSKLFDLSGWAALKPDDDTKLQDHTTVLQGGPQSCTPGDGCGLVHVAFTRSSEGKGKGDQGNEHRTHAKVSEGPAKSAALLELKQRALAMSAQGQLPGDVGEESDSDLDIVSDAGKRNAVAPVASVKRLTVTSNPARRFPTEKMRDRKKLEVKDKFEELQRKSKQQAHAYRAERLAELKSRGILVQTAEEKLKEIQEVDDLLEKARRENIRIRKQEMKDEKLANGEALSGDDDDEEDGDWLESNDEGMEGDQEELEEEDPMAFISGSEEEDTGVEEGLTEAAVECGNRDENPMDKEAIETDGSDCGESRRLDPRSPSSFSLSSLYAGQNCSPTSRLSEMPELYEGDDDSQGIVTDIFGLKKKRKPRRVIEEDEEMEDVTLTEETEEKNHIPLFGGSAPVGLTQMFEGTIGDASEKSEIPTEPTTQINDKNSIADDDEMVPNTQTGFVDLTYSQTQDNDYSFGGARAEDSFLSAFHEEEMPDPTQEEGTIPSTSPAPPRFDDKSEGSEVEEKPIRKRKGKLARRRVDFSDDEPLDEDGFAIMKTTRAKNKRDKMLDKANSEARRLVEEQAEESEDEYAGLGGISDEEDVDDAGDLEDLLDETEQIVDEDALAAFNAAREKEEDDRQLKKIFNDVSKGLLRKRRGTEFDISDSEDEREARIRAIQKKNARMRKALLEDVELGKIASDPKKVAFLNAIEDLEKEDESNFLDQFDDEEQPTPPTGAPNRSGEERSVPGREEAATVDTESEGSRDCTPKADEYTATLSTPPSRNKRKWIGSRKSSHELSRFQEKIKTEADDSSDSEIDLEMFKKRRTIEVVDRSSVLQKTAVISAQSGMAFTRESKGTATKIPSIAKRFDTSTTATTLKQNISRPSQTNTSSGAIKKTAKTTATINYYARDQAKAKALNGTKKEKLPQKEKGGAFKSLLGTKGFT